MATIRRVPSVEHNFQLVITRVYEEGDQELLEDEEESTSFVDCDCRVLTFDQPTKNAYSSLVKSSSFIQVRQRENPHLFGAIYKAMLTNSMNSLHLGQTHLQRLSSRRACTVPCMSASTRRAQTARGMKIWPNSYGSSSSIVLLLIVSRAHILRPAAANNKGKGPARKSPSKDGVRPSQSPTSPTTNTPDSSLEVIIDEKAELFLWDRDEGYFVREASVSAKIVQRRGAKFLFFLTATSQEGQVLAHRITSQMMQRWSPATWSLTWNNVNESGNQSSWCLRFESQDSFEDFRAEFTKRAWENLNEMSWDKVKVCYEKVWCKARPKYM